MQSPEQHALEVTVTYPPNGACREDDVAPLRVARKAAAAVQASEAVRRLLTSRLRLAFLLVTAVFGTVGCFAIVIHALNPGPVPPRIRYGLAFFGGLSVVLIALTVFLWSRRPHPLTQLRACELALVGLFALGCVWKQMSYLDVASTLARQHGDWGTTILGAYHGAFWFALLTIYGLFVPNSWRRCAVVVGLIAACPFALALAQAGHGDWPLAGRPFLYYLGGLGFWAGFGALLALFGSHHLEVLRQQASEARELGQYRLTRRLGTGGMGEVYLAEHRLLRRPCAVKLIRPERFGDPDCLRLFEQEVQATATLTHPNTVEIYDYGHAEDGTFYYIMEYLPGLSLEELVRRHGPLPPGRVVFLLRQVCDALSEAHAVGLIHRDVKPGNIITCVRGGAGDVAKLLDFGLVQRGGGKSLPEEASRPHGITGTPAYMSPEQAAGRERLDGCSDLYSVGAVAYFLLTGRPPFVRGTVLEMLAAHRDEPATFPHRLDEQLPADLQAVVLRCLAKDPADRFADAARLEQALAACSCATAWTREQAARWWQECAAESEASPSPVLQPTAPA
jgi:serine/threonine-protein kinase